MPERVNRTKRLVINGMRLLEGASCDWYETKDGEIVILCLKRIKDGDVVLMEYPNFSEEHLAPDDLFRECRCGQILPMRSGCVLCRKRDLEDRARAVEHEIKTYQDRLAKLLEEIAELNSELRGEQ